MEYKINECFVVVCFDGNKHFPFSYCGHGQYQTVEEAQSDGYRWCEYYTRRGGSAYYMVIRVNESNVVKSEWCGDYPREHNLKEEKDSESESDSNESSSDSNESE